MDKMQIGMLVIAVIGLLLILNFLSWTNAKVIDGLTENPEQESSFKSNLLIFLAGVLIVGVVAVWVVVVAR